MKDQVSRKSHVGPRVGPRSLQSLRSHNKRLASFELFLNVSFSLALVTLFDHFWKEGASDDERNKSSYSYND